MSFIVTLITIEREQNNEKEANAYKYIPTE